MSDNETLNVVPIETLESDVKESLRLAQRVAQIAHLNPLGPKIRVGAVVRTKQGKMYPGPVWRSPANADLCAPSKSHWLWRIWVRIARTASKFRWFFVTRITFRHLRPCPVVGASK